MLQIRSSHRLDQVELGLRAAVEKHGGHILAISNVGHLLAEGPAPPEAAAASFTLCFTGHYKPLLDAEIRLAAFLPVRVAVCEKKEGVFLETLSPREFCRLLHRADLDPLAGALEETLRAVMQEAAAPHALFAAEAAAAQRSTEDQVNMRAALPQRIDCHGTKVEELAGTGVHDAQGG